VIQRNFFSRSETELKERIARMLGGPVQGKKAFVISQVNFADLYAMAAHLRRYFQECVAEPLVCLCTEDKAVVAAAMLASLAGGPALVMPHSFAPQVLAEVRELTGFRHAVVDGPRSVPDGVRTIAPRSGEAVWPPADELSPKGVETEWVRLFTGGSTGAPKMWTKTVRNLLAETIAIIEHYAVTDADRLVATVSPCHIYGLLYAILTPLLADAAVAAPTPSFPVEIEEVVNQSRATVLISVPAHYRALNGHPFAPRGLRLAFSSAGMLAAEDAGAFSGQTGVGIAEIYGSTETGGIAARVRANGETDFKPYDTVDVRIEGERFKVRSDYLSPGLADPGDGYFTMGDRVVPTEGGRFALLGRVDGVVKVGGQRVDLEAVCQTIKAYPGVRDALVLSLPVGRGRENQIVAVVEGNLDAAALNRSLLDDLEPYARPRSIKVVAKMPLTAAGKYDRHAIEKLWGTPFTFQLSQEKVEK
jgi:acyl-CoA synthetase (AMP-forming)/AMP-acid ligase II